MFEAQSAVWTWRNLSFDFKKSDFILKLKQKTLLYNGTHAQRQTYVSATDKNQKESGFPSQCWEQLQRSFLISPTGFMELILPFSFQTLILQFLSFYS